ncbi:hypothetical protein [Clostridium tyrobutyricum]|jgi:outer membrane biosynthesis protein TonB|uniref:hypothetical protein n=1 Tax=Clostridium tyrobutyricum TaxID=1519 RepID=UPI00189F9FC0|nr:hypothetical protein [Clostridium tyrobutyricum]MBV4427126.1 hypothetical protein [Clostridium tyrobutyricum]MBV4442147.1 hypothetical protein [Clostridium tyrobutyricum]MBV4442282.1 hypothetical protein [Clostridium tyrobutyricum]
MKITAEFNSNEELLSFISTFGTKSLLPEVGVQELKEVTQKPTVKKETKVESTKNTKIEDKPENITKPAEAPKADKKSEPKDEKQKITKEMVRAVFTKLIKAGKQKEAKDLTKKYGANRLPDIKEEDFEAVYKEAEELI